MNRVRRMRGIDCVGVFFIQSNGQSIQNNSICLWQGKQKNSDSLIKKALLCQESLVPGRELHFTLR